MQRTDERRPVLVTGVPRSGTTWVASVLAGAAGGTLVHEPDNEKEHLDALTAKRALGRFPVLDPGQRAADYERLWRSAFANGTPQEGGVRDRLAHGLWRRLSEQSREEAVQGRRGAPVRFAAALAGAGRPVVRSTGPVIVKSVHLALSLHWLLARAPDTRVLLVLRHPANVLSSWLELNLPDQDRRLDSHPAVRQRYLARWGIEAPPPDRFARAAWQACLLTAALCETAAEHPQVVVTEHESLCRAPADTFASVCADLGIGWDDHAAALLESLDRPGDGFELRRLASEQPDRWRTRLDPSAFDELVAVARRFPHLDRWPELASATSKPAQG